MVRQGDVLALFLCVAAIPCATAQTLTSITINGAPSGNFYTGAFAELTATGTFTSPEGPITVPIYVNWTSSDSTVVSVDNTSGVATALKGSATPITITATAPGTSVPPATITIPSVLPQTALYSADGNTLTVYDVTFAQNPTLTTTVNYLTSTGTVNQNNAIPMALSSDERYLFIASPGYYSTTSSNFTVVAIDTQTFKVAARISSSLLCYPTSIAVAGGNLYVVNAGPSVAQNAAATDGGCASGATHPSPNVEMYSIADVPSVQQGLKTWTPGTNVTQAANSSTDAFSYVPISVAASADQTDGSQPNGSDGTGLVYVGSVANLSGSTFDAGLISSFTSGTTTLVNQVVMHTADKLAVAPLGLSVITAYPTSWTSPPVDGAGNFEAVHTVAFTGPGVVGSTNGGYMGYFSDQCQNAAQTSGCTVGGTTTPATDAFTSGAVTTAPFWLSTSASPDGHSFYAAVNDYAYFFSSSDGTSSDPYGTPTVFDTEGVRAGQCTSCLPVTSVTTKSDESTIYAGSIGQIDVLNPDDFSSLLTVSPITARSILVSQHPEIKLNLVQKGIDLTGTNFTVSGNFQNPNPVYAPSCAWGAGQPPWNPGNQPPQSPTGQPFDPNLPDYSQVPPQDVQVIPAISRDANDPPGSIIVGVSVGPVTTTLTEDSLTVAVGGSDNLAAQVTNANNDSTVTWQLQSFPACTSLVAQGASCPLGVIVANGNSLTYHAPAAQPSSALGSPIITAIPDADTADLGSRASVTLTLVTPPSGSYQPTSLTFTTQNVHTTSAAQTVTLTNTGQQDLALSSAPQIAGANNTDFAVSSTTCTLGLILSTNSSCTISVTFTPTAAGPRNATLQVTDDSGGTTGTVQSLTLSGTGQSPGIFNANPTSLTFVAQTLQTTSAAQTVTVTNTGLSDFTLVSASIALPSDFAAASGTTCTANLAIAPSGSCVINVTFTPTAAGTRNGTLTITYNTGGGSSNATQDVTLTGTGQTPGAATVNPASLTFTVQTLQTTSAAQTVTVTNTGQASLTLVSALIALPSDFATASGTTCTANLAIAANGSCVIKVTFTPTATGTRNGTLIITYNTGGGPNATQNVTLAGTGQSPAAINVNPTSLTFAAQTLQTTSAAQTVTVTNTGQASLTLVGASIALPSDFATAAGTTCTANLSIAANGTCVINVTFTPTAGGTRNGMLTITYNTGGASNATQNVSLTGTGQAPAASVSPTSLTFSAQGVGATSAGQIITVTSSGQGNLILGAVPTITGANAGDFAIAAGTTCTASQSITPGGSCAINITFTPTAAGTRNAMVVVTDNAGGTAGATQSVSLSGSALSITVFPASPQLEAGTTQTFLPNILPSSASGPVTWSVTGTGCGGHACGSIDANGVYTVPSNLGGPATDTIKAVLNSNTAIFGTTQASLFLKPVLSSGQTATVQAGQAAMYNLSILGGTGDALSPLKIQCLTETLPNGVSCQTVTVQPGTATVTFTFTAQTTGPQSAAIRSSQVLLGGFVLVVPFCCLMRFRKQVRRSSMILAIFAVVALSWIGLVGCGTNGTFGSTTPKTFGGTPVGTYTIQLQGTGPSGTPESIGTVGLVVQ